ncbi:PQ loop repeat-domain-containing protein [Peziza echinospora]|nr:PQ loop repeat-domain-containing protein [Peziza echinospora]
MTLYPTCVPTHPFLETLSQYLSTCIPTPLALLSTVFGLCSMTAWLFSQLPQIVKNHKSKSVDGLSPIFLLNWLLGDVCNFLGAVILRQMIFQQVIGGYYVLVDICLMSQFIWYSLIQPIMIRRNMGKAYYNAIVVDEYESDSDCDSEAEFEGKHAPMVIEGLSPPMSLSSSAASSYIPSSSFGGESSKGSYLGEKKREKKYMKYGSSGSNSFLGGGGVGRNSAQMMVMFAMMVAIATAFPENKLQRKYVSPFAAAVGGTVVTPTTGTDMDTPLVAAKAASGFTIEVLGKILSWVSTALYCTSRIPQLYKNYSRRSTSGLSIMLFIAAFFGNLFYSLSLLTNPLAWEDFGPYGGGGVAGPEGSLRSEWWGNTLPFFLGASGVLCQDALVFVQWCWYGEGATTGMMAEGGEGEGEVVGGGERVKGKKARSGGTRSTGALEGRGLRGEEEEQGQRRFLLASHAGGFLVGTPPGMGYGTVFAR